MEREEAIRAIGWLKCTTNREDDLEAIDMAIEALHREEAEEKGYCHRIIPSNVEVVVRCKDCRYRNGKVNRKGFEVCDATGMDITDEDFCSWGERQEL